MELVANTLRAIADYAKNDRAEFVRTVQEAQNKQQTADINKKRKRLSTAQRRAGELEKLICRIYEDNTLGKLPDARYMALDAQYAKEQDALSDEIVKLEKAIGDYESSRKSAEQFISLIDKYQNFDTIVLPAKFSGVKSSERVDAVGVSPTASKVFAINSTMWQKCFSVFI